MLAIFFLLKILLLLSLPTFISRCYIKISTSFITRKLDSGYISYSRLPCLQVWLAKLREGDKIFEWGVWFFFPSFLFLLLSRGCSGMSRDWEREEIVLRLDQCVIVLNPASQWGHCFHLSNFQMKTLTLWKTLHIFISDMEISSQPFGGRAPLISSEVLLTPSGVSRRGNQILLPHFLTLCH